MPEWTEWIVGGVFIGGIVGGAVRWKVTNYLDSRHHSLIEETLEGLGAMSHSQFLHIKISLQHIERLLEAIHNDIQKG